MIYEMTAHADVPFRAKGLPLSVDLIIRTVRGPIAPKTAGTALMHEHLLFDFTQPE